MPTRLKTINAEKEKRKNKKEKRKSFNPANIRSFKRLKGSNAAIFKRNTNKRHARLITLLILQH